MSGVDLHLHTSFSDGLLTPEELVRRAHAAGITTLAVCDHDNVDGIAAARRQGVLLGVEVISGVELSSQWREYRDIHILGYGFDPEHPRLRAELGEFQEFRERRNELIVARVNQRLEREGKAPIAFSRVRELAGGTIGRPHIAQALREQGHVSDTEDAFQRYLVPCNVDKRFFPADEAIALIRAAGGVAVLAHPHYISHDDTILRRLIGELAGLGLDGVEAYNNGAVSRHEVERMSSRARYLGLIVTGGSDFHAPEEGARLGWCRCEIAIPARCGEELRAALAKRQASA